MSSATLASDLDRSCSSAASACARAAPTTREEEERREERDASSGGDGARVRGAAPGDRNLALERRGTRGIRRGFVETRPGTDAERFVHVLVRVLLGRRHLGVGSDAVAVRQRDVGELRVRRRAERLREF